MKRFTLVLLVLCLGFPPSVGHAQDPVPDTALRSLNKKLDLILKRMDSIDRRLDELERDYDDSRFSLLRTPEKSRNTEPAPLAFDFAFRLKNESNNDGERIFSGTEEGMRIDALQRKLRLYRMDMMQKQ